MKFNIYQIRYFIVICLPLWFLAGSGCEKQKSDMPTWIEIDSLKFSKVGAPPEFTSSSRFTDAWVYVNSNLVGSFELPARIPILAEGNTNVIIFPGIQVNGLTALRSPYLKIARFDQNINLVPGETIHLNPVFTLDTSITNTHNTGDSHFELLENFEGNTSKLGKSSGAYGDFYVVASPQLSFEGNKCALLSHNGAENTITQAENSQWLTLPKGDVGGMFFEMNYKCNTSFTVSLLAKPTDGTAATQKIGVIGINPSDTWKKIYIALSPAVNSFTVGNQFKLAIAYTRKPEISVQEVYIDNIQIFY